VRLHGKLTGWSRRPMCEHDHITAILNKPSSRRIPRAPVSRCVDHKPIKPVLLYRSIGRIHDYLPRSRSCHCCCCCCCWPCCCANCWTRRRRRRSSSLPPTVSDSQPSSTPTYPSTSRTCDVSDRAAAAGEGSRYVTSPTAVPTTRPIYRIPYIRTTNDRQTQR